MWAMFANGAVLVGVDQQTAIIPALKMCRRRATRQKIPPPNNLTPTILPRGMGIHIPLYSAAYALLRGDTRLLV